MLNVILGIIFGGAVVTVIYETYFEKKEKKVGELLAPKVEALIEVSSMEILKKQKNLERKLTETEKNSILDDCYNKL